MKLDIEQRARSVQLEETMSIEELAFYAAWLEAERDRLREALEFYADGDWNERYPCGVWYDHDEAIIDFGQVARAALRKADDDN